MNLLQKKRRQTESGQRRPHGRCGAVGCEGLMVPDISPRQRHRANELRDESIRSQVSMFDDQNEKLDLVFHQAVPAISISNGI